MAALRERHADAHRHRADELGAGGTGVEDPAGREHPEQPAHADLARDRVDLDLREVRAERVP